MLYNWKKCKFFKHQLRDKLYFAETKTLKNTIIKVLQDIKPDKNKNQYILFSPAAASFDQFSNFENRVTNLKGCAGNMLESSYKFLLINYWRSIDKKILLVF